MRKLKLREVKELAEGHRTGKLEPDPSLGLIDTKDYILHLIVYTPFTCSWFQLIRSSGNYFIKALSSAVHSQWDIQRSPLLFLLYTLSRGELISSWG